MKKLIGTSLYITVAKKDITYINYTIPHIIKSCNYDFEKILLVIDTKRSEGFHRQYENDLPYEVFMKKCMQIARQSHNITIEEIDYGDRNKIKQLTRKYFDRSITMSRDYRGNLMYGFIFGIESLPSDYIVHFDSDILIHSDSDYSWIKEGIKILDECDDIITVSPLSGPPRKDKKIIQDKGVKWVLDKRGFYKIQNFTTRKFMIKKNKFYEQLLPLPTKHISWKRYLYHSIFGGSSLLALEQLISLQMKNKDMHRADISSGRIWSLHTPDHGEKFCKYLPEIIKTVEEGKYPEGNAGRYDLDLDYFIELINKNK